MSLTAAIAIAFALTFVIRSTSEWCRAGRRLDDRIAALKALPADDIDLWESELNTPERTTP